MGSRAYGSLKLFGVSIVAGEEDETMRKCMSMENLGTFNVDHSATVDNGYDSDGLLHSKKAKGNYRRKKGVPWTEEEHMSFLAGLEKLGKGDWKGISRYHVPSRTPTQVASHAQKYFLRLASTDKKRRRSSLFDLSFKQPETPKSSLPELPLSPYNKVAEIPPQASTSAPVATPMAAAQVLVPAASYRAPNFHQMPYIPVVGVTSNGQSFPGAKAFPTVWSVSATSTFPNHGYIYLPRNVGDFANSKPCVSKSSSSLPHQKKSLLKHGSEPHIGAV